MEKINLNPDFIEAQMFAWFADKALSGEAFDLSQVTGSKTPVVLGAIYPGKKRSSYAEYRCPVDKGNSIKF
jgi:anhydro-N-acetylmuramic acid kinase